MKKDPKTAVGHTKPTLDQLFALKRAERPDDAFWQDFEVRLRQKQLAAMIEPAPWWYGFLLYWRRVDGLKRMVPVAAAASVACLLVLRLSDGGEVPVGNVRVADVTQQAVAHVASVVSARETELFRAEASGEMRTPAKDQTGAAAPAASFSQVGGERVLVANASTQEGRGLALAGSTGLGSEADLSAVSADALKAADSAGTMSVDSVGVAAFSADSGFALGLASSSEAGQSSASAPEDGLAALNFDAAWQQGVADSDQLDMFKLSPRQARLLAVVEDVGAPGPTKALAHVRDRVVRRLETDDELYASASRVGVSGDRLSLKF